MFTGDQHTQSYQLQSNGLNRSVGPIAQDVRNGNRDHLGVYLLVHHRMAPMTYTDYMHYAAKCLLWCMAMLATVLCFYRTFVVSEIVTPLADLSKQVEQQQQMVDILALEQKHNFKMLSNQ